MLFFFFGGARVLGGLTFGGGIFPGWAEGWNEQIFDWWPGDSPHSRKIVYIIKPFTNNKNMRKPVLTLFRMGFFGAAQGWWRGEPLPKISEIYPTMMKLGTVISYLKKFRKLTLGVLLTSAFFTRNQRILLYQDIQI